MMIKIWEGEVDQCFDLCMEFLRRLGIDLRRKL